MEALVFLQKLSNEEGGGRIVSTADLTVFEIASARAEDRLFVDDKGFGYVYFAK